MPGRLLYNVLYGKRRECLMWILLTYVFLPIVAILVLNWLFKRSMK